ncbi:ion channel [Haloflavibacter putidus]|uniref:Two pore domain potassium channel family protein n=1 Tax=Haloflavibacter putidus TaxID=2576776 RepID=A0A507ZZL6_9FLAO|nr:ion channel [Haloflavibacter putidus]TQD40115.1 two pore domain potassium channel family protein [Haloflavibacter putidus]
MKILLIGLGIAVQLLVLVDMFKTIVNINGAGQLSNWVSKKVWRLFFIIARGNGDNKILNICGPIILLTFLFMWITLIWFGYSLIFISDHNSVLNNHTQEPATALGQVYYVGYTLTSLGNGDYRAGSGVWQIVSNIMGLNSMIFISLGISYILPVLQAVVDKRTLAVHIDKLGATPEEIIENGYNGDNFEPLYQRFSNLENLLIKHGERHLAYPILHYFHSNKKAHAVTLSLAVLDETITIQEVYQIDKSTKRYHWYILRGALDNFFERLDSSFILAAKEAPPFDYFEKLSDKFTMENKKECLKKIKNMEERRRKIKGYIRNDGWNWKDVKIARSKKDK